MAILVLNAGSSTLKATLLRPGSREPVAHETVEWGADATARSDRAGDLRRLLDSWSGTGVLVGDVRAVGHRVVHGGTSFAEPVLVDDAVIRALDDLADLAPLHNPVAVETLRAARQAMPGVPHVVCFDTAFHATLEEPAWRYPVPRRWTEEWGIRRYGFHGLSVEWSVRRAAELLEQGVDDLRLVVAHLGSGSSVTAVDRGRSVWTSMGYTPLEGPMMGTRAGSIDPGILLALIADGRLGAEVLAADLEHRSGLLAIGGSADMRELATRARHDAAAALAVEMYVRRAAQALAAAATALPALDAIVFTGGIGEGAAGVRRSICDRLRTLGVAAVGTRSDDGLLTEDGQRPAVLRVEAREDVVIADATAAVIGRPSA